MQTAATLTPEKEMPNGDDEASVGVRAYSTSCTVGIQTGNGCVQAVQASRASEGCFIAGYKLLPIAVPLQSIA